jgi:hypothetical protein
MTKAFRSARREQISRELGVLALERAVWIALWLSEQLKLGTLHGEIERVWAKTHALRLELDRRAEL